MIEDMVFDYFGILAIQYELSNNKWQKDVQFQIDKMTRHAEIAKTHLKRDQPAVPLSVEKAQILGKKISEFTLNLMKGLSTKDEASGRTIFNPQDSGFEVMLSMEKDKFKAETGYSTEYVSGILRRHKKRSLSSRWPKNSQIRRKKKATPLLSLRRLRTRK